MLISSCTLEDVDDNNGDDNNNKNNDNDNNSSNNNDNNDNNSNNNNNNTINTNVVTNLCNIFLWNLCSRNRKLFSNITAVWHFEEIEERFVVILASVSG